MNEFAITLLLAWSACIFAAISLFEKVPGLAERGWWAALLPLLPMILGALTGPFAVPILANFLPWLEGLGSGSAMVIGAGAGAVAASSDKVRRQTILRNDRRLNK